MPDPTPPTRNRPAAVLIGLGVLVVALGFGIPQLAPPPANSPPEPAAPRGPAVQPTDASLGVALARLAGGLVVVCALCVVATRYLGRRAESPPGAMKVLASLQVGPRCAVHLVSAGGRRLLIGTDPTGAKALIELPGEPEPDPVPAEEVAETATPDGAVVVGPVSVVVGGRASG